MRRPASVWIAFGTLVFLAVTAVPSGIVMLLTPEGNEYLPVEVLEGTPIDTWTLPGLLLLFAFGLGSAATAVGVLLRAPRIMIGPFLWSWWALVALGLGMLVWISLELLLISEHSFLEAVYGMVGAILVITAALGSTRSYLRGMEA
jgi:hypothetical protein